MKYCIYILALLIFALLGGAMYLFFFSHIAPWDLTYTVTPVTIPETYEQRQEQIATSHRQNADLYNTALRDNQPGLCDQISDTSKQIECHDMITAQSIQKSGDLTSCDSIQTPNIATLCRDAISSDRAIAGADRTICATLSSAI